MDMRVVLMLLGLAVVVLLTLYGATRGGQEREKTVGGDCGCDETQTAGDGGFDVAD